MKRYYITHRVLLHLYEDRDTFTKKGGDVMAYLMKCGTTSDVSVMSQGLDEGMAEVLMSGSVEGIGPVNAIMSSSWAFRHALLAGRYDDFGRFVECRAKELKADDPSS